MPRPIGTYTVFDGELLIAATPYADVAALVYQHGRIFKHIAQDSRVCCAIYGEDVPLWTHENDGDGSDLTRAEFTKTLQARRESLSMRAQ